MHAVIKHNSYYYMHAVINGSNYNKTVTKYYADINWHRKKSLKNVHSQSNWDSNI